MLLNLVTRFEVSSLVWFQVFDQVTFLLEEISAIVKKFQEPWVAWVLHFCMSV